MRALGNPMLRFEHWLSIGTVWRATGAGQAESQRCITNEESRNFADLNFQVSD